MYRPVHSWVKVPVTKPAPHLHRTLCLEYPPKLLSGQLHQQLSPRNVSPKNNSRDAAKTGPQSLIVMVPGNPGLCQFYGKFLSELCQTIPNLGAIVPSLGGFSLATSELHHSEHHHHNHSSSSSSSSSALTDDEEFSNKQVFLLKDQYEFMYSFVEHFVIPIIEKWSIPTERVWICGHSIGGEISLHVLDHFKNYYNKSKGVFHRTVLLAPTIAYMEDSSNAKKLYNLIHHGKHFLPTLISGILTKILPKSVIDSILDMMLANELDAIDIDVAQKLVHHPRITRQLLKLASDELYTVNPLDVELLRKIQKNIIFYYVQEDEWVPSKLHDELREKFDDGKKFGGFFVGEDPTIKHAWCSKSFKPVAHFVTHAFGAVTGVDVGIVSVEAEKAGFVLSENASSPRESGKRRSRSSSK